jgi:hypothetical protein
MIATGSARACFPEAGDRAGERGECRRARPGCAAERGWSDSKAKRIGRFEPASRLAQDPEGLTGK